MTYSFAQQMPTLPPRRPSQDDLNFPSLPTNAPSPDAPRWPKPITAAEVVASSPTPDLTATDSTPHNADAQLLLYSKLVPTASAVPRNPLRSLGGGGLRSTGSVAASKQPAPPPPREPLASRMQSLSSDASRTQLARRVAKHQHRSPAPPRRLADAFARDAPRPREKADVPPGFEPRRQYPREERPSPPSNARAEAFRDAITMRPTARPPRRQDTDEIDRVQARRLAAEKEEKMIKILAKRTAADVKAKDTNEASRSNIIPVPSDHTLINPPPPTQRAAQPVAHSDTNGLHHEPASVSTKSSQAVAAAELFTEAAETPRGNKNTSTNSGAWATDDAHFSCSSLNSTIDGRSLQFDELQIVEKDKNHAKSMNGRTDERHGGAEALVKDLLHAEEQEESSQAQRSGNTLSMIDMMCHIHAGSASVLLNGADGEDILLPPLPNPEEGVRFESLLRSMGWTPPDEDESRVLNGQDAQVGYYSHFP